MPPKLLSFFHVGPSSAKAVEGYWQFSLSSSVYPIKFFVYPVYPVYPNLFICVCVCPKKNFDPGVYPCAFKRLSNVCPPVYRHHQSRSQTGTYPVVSLFAFSHVFIGCVSCVYPKKNKQKCASGRNRIHTGAKSVAVASGWWVVNWQVRYDQRLALKFSSRPSLWTPPDKWYQFCPDVMEQAAVFFPEWGGDSQKCQTIAYFPFNHRARCLRQEVCARDMIF